MTNDIRFRRLAQLLICLPACAALMTTPAAAGAPPARPPAATTVLACRPYAENGRDRELQIVRMPLATEFTAEQIAEYARRFPDDPGPQNNAFLLVDKPAGGPGGKTLFAMYRGDGIWSADVAPAADHKRAYVVLVHAADPTVLGSWMWVFDVDLGKSVGEHPLRLDMKDYAQWPKPAKPVTLVNLTFLDDEMNRAGAARQIKALARGDDLLLFLERLEPTATPAQYRLDLKTGDLFKIKFAERRLEAVKKGSK